MCVMRKRGFGEGGNMKGKKQEVFVKERPYDAWEEYLTHDRMLRNRVHTCQGASWWPETLVLRLEGAASDARFVEGLVFLKRLTGREPEKVLSKKSVDTFRRRKGDLLLVKTQLRGQAVRAFLEFRGQVALPSERGFEGCPSFLKSAVWQYSHRSLSSFFSRNPSREREEQDNAKRPALHVQVISDAGAARKGVLRWRQRKVTEALKTQPAPPRPVFERSTAERVAKKEAARLLTNQLVGVRRSTYVPRVSSEEGSTSLGAGFSKSKGEAKGAGKRAGSASGKGAKGASKKRG